MSKRPQSAPMEASCTKERGGVHRQSSKGSGRRRKTTDRPHQSRSDNRPLFRMATSIFVAVCISFSSFYVGVITGIRAAPRDCQEQEWTPNLSDKAVQQKVEELARQKMKSQFVELCKKIAPGTKDDKPHTSLSKNNPGSSLFIKPISHFAQGLAHISKVDLMETSILVCQSMQTARVWMHLYCTTHKQHCH